MKLIPALALLCLMVSPIQSAPEKPQDLAPILKPILEKSKLPSLAAALVVGDELKAIGAVGVRKLGDEKAVTVDDKYHLGSNTKPLTATLAAVMVEEGTVKWTTTIGEVLGKKVKKMDKGYGDVTLEQLLAHVGGVPGDAPRAAWLKAYLDQGKIPATEQRLTFVNAVLSKKPDYKPGSKTVYSNQGYAVVGVMLETLAGKPWEDLLRERVFVPLGMDSAGFREPDPEDKVDQPCGHVGKKPVKPGVKADNPDAIGPAGTVHASIGDWAEFAQFHLQKKPGKVLKKAESFEKLNSTLKNSKTHGVGGWLVQGMDRFGGHFVQMTGSNTMWFSLLWILPGEGKAIVVTTNSAQPNAFETCDRVVAKLMGLK